jgi:MFS family permease
LGYTAIGSFSATAVLSPWFPKSKGVMLGIADSGNPTGQAVITPLTQFTISNFGWRAGFQVIGIIFFLVTTPLNFLFQRKPPDFNDNSINSEPTDLETVSIDRYNSNSEIHSNAEPIDPIEIQKFSAFREPAVWFLLLSRSTGSISHQMTNLHIIAFFVLAGYGEMQSATALGASGLIGIIARPTFGILSDKLGRELVFTIAMGMTFLSIMVVILLTSGSSLWALILFVALTGLSDGLSGLILGAKAADLYPPHVLGSVMGIIDIGRGIGWAAGGILTGLLFDIFGDYTLAYWAAAFLVLLSIGSQWVVKLVEPKKLLPETF